MEAIIPHALASEIRFFHVEGVQMFSQETLDAGLLSVVRIGVEGGGGEGGKREQVEKIWRQAKGLLVTRAGFEHVGGWRIEKEQGREEREEFVVVGAWRDEDALGRFAQGEESQAWDEVWKGVVLDIDVKTYSRIA